MRTFFALLLILVATPAMAATEIPVTLGGRVLHLPLPKGYCPLDRRRPFENLEFETYSHYAGDSPLLAMAADCAELEAERAQKGEPSRIIVFRTFESDGQPVSVPDSARSELLEKMVEKAPPGDMKAIVDTVETQRMLPSARSRISETSLVGLDEAALCVARVFAVERNTKAYVGAMTVAGGRLISTMIFRNYADRETLPALLDETKHEARALVAANSAGAASQNPQRRQ